MDFFAAQFQRQKALEFWAAKIRTPAKMLNFPNRFSDEIVFIYTSRFPVLSNLVCISQFQNQFKPPPKNIHLMLDFVTNPLIVTFLDTGRKQWRTIRRCQKIRQKINPSLDVGAKAQA